MRDPASPTRAWVVVAVGFVALAASFSTRSSLGLAMTPWEQEFGWTRTFLSSSGALALVMMACVAPLTGNLVDRAGPRPFFAGGLGLVGLGAALIAVMSEPWHLVGAYGVIAGVGFGTVAIHVVSTAVAGFAERRRGLAIGVATAGATAGQLVIMPALSALLAVAGWRTVFASLALLALGLAALAWFLVAPGRAAAPRSSGAVAQAPVLARVGALARTPVFHALFWTYVVCGFTTSGVVEVHLLPYAAFCGYPPLTSATAYGVLSAFNLLGMILAGHLADRVHRPILLAAIYILRGLSFVLLLYIVEDVALLFLFAVMFGLFDYATVPVTASLVASRLGLRVMGLAMGLLSAGHSVGAALGAQAAGVLFDLFARYAWVWLASVALAVGAGLVALTIAERRRADTALAPV
jgi:MFS family permease